MNSYKLRLSEITQTLLRPEDDFIALAKALTDLEHLFFSITGLTAENPDHKNPIALPNGKAIGPFWAGFCVKDMLRTKRFVKGLCLAVKEAQRIFPGRTINVLYAGTGPFASLAMPLTTVLHPSEVSFILLEINRFCIEALEKVVEAFDARSYVKKIVQADATVFEKDEDTPVHIVLTETMQHALKAEPQVAITLNLAPQLEEGGILIPQNVKVKAGLLNPEKNQSRMLGELSTDEKCCFPLKDIFKLNLKTAKALAKTEKQPVVPSEHVGLPQPIPDGFNQLCLLTSIQVFGECKLNYWESGLTLPLLLMDLSRSRELLSGVSFQYELSDRPGFTFKVFPN